MLFPFVGKSVNLNAVDLDWNNYASLFNLIHNNDPLSSYNIYVTIISALTMAVPALTAQLCMGATGLYDIFKTTLDKNANRFNVRKSAMARREFANVAKGKVDRLSFQAMQGGAQEAIRNPGYTEQGISRRWSGEGAVGRYAHAQAYRARFNSDFSRQQNEWRNYIAGMTGRKMSYLYKNHGQLVSAGLNQAQEKYLTRAFGTGGHIPFLSSDSMNSPNTNLVKFPEKPPAGDNEGE